MIRDKDIDKSFLLKNNWDILFDETFKYIIKGIYVGKNWLKYFCFFL